MSAQPQNRELITINWVVAVTMPHVMMQIKQYRPHYIDVIGDNHIDYIMQIIASHYCIAPRGWQRQFRRAPRKLANRAYYRICLDLESRP